jgi:archaellum component FlaF (FlaF/FlaG flagellin family)
VWRGNGQDLSISIRYIKNADGRIVVTGSTNLPGKAALMISLTPKASGRNPMQTQTEVLPDGTYVSEAFGPSSGVPDGQYTIDVTLPIAKTQPESVRTLIGDKGQNLKGPLVKDFSIWGNVARVEEDIIVGTPTGALTTQWKLLDNEATRQVKANADEQAQQISRPSPAATNGITRENTRSWLYEGTHVSANSSNLKQGMTGEEAQDTLQWWYLKMVSASTYGDLKIEIYRTEVKDAGVPDVWLTFHNGQLHDWSIIANP